MSDEIPLRVRMAIAGDRWFRRVISGLTAALIGLWLGILDSDHLAMKTTAAYDDEDTFSSDDHNLAGLTITTSPGYGHGSERSSIDTSPMGHAFWCRAPGEDERCWRSRISATRWSASTPHPR